MDSENNKKINEMGNNCCTGEARNEDPSYSMRTGKMKNSGDAGNNAPSADFSEKVSQMNPVNEKVDETSKKLKPFSAKSEKNYDDLPTLGPYRYTNGATYQGQYSNGFRTGYGKQVRLEFRGCFSN